MEPDVENYKVHLEMFEGPLDLLLHLIKKDDVNLYEISIARLLEQYLEYLKLAGDLNIDLAGEFVEMASELTYIKSKRLLPVSEDEEEEGPDPRADLIARLLEYQRYKLAAQSLLQRPLLGRDVFTRPEFKASKAETDSVEGPMIAVDNLSLLTAFHNLLKRLPQATVHEVNQPRLGVTEKIMELTEFLKVHKQVTFEDLFEGAVLREDLVVTFLAILEMAKQRLLRVLQDRVFDRIFVYSLLLGEDTALPPNPSSGESGAIL